MLNLQQLLSQRFAGSVLDLFQAKPSLYKLSFWRDDATYEDP
jgi:hypothetical protein